MADWACHFCRGLGMHWSDDSTAFVPCHCADGQAKREYLEKGEEALRRAALDRGRRKRKKEKVPF